jgi:hypothetical protein
MLVFSTLIIHCLSIKVIRAENLPRPHKLREFSYYAVVKVDEKEWKTTESPGRTPVWEQIFPL